jgi:hypothetical protein
MSLAFAVVKLYQITMTSHVDQSKNLFFIKLDNFTILNNKKTQIFVQIKTLINNKVWDIFVDTSESFK